jgi:hypothetical protein
MKINKINVMIRRAENKHKPYLNNDIMKLMSEFKFGGKYANDSIELSNAPEAVTSVLDKLKIVFRRIHD